MNSCDTVGKLKLPHGGAATHSLKTADLFHKGKFFRAFVRFYFSETTGCINMQFGTIYR